MGAAEEIDAELLVKNIEEHGSAEGPPQTEEAPDTPSPETSAESAVQRFKYKALGKEIEEDLDTILKRASMGYDYAQKMEEFKKQQAEWDPRIKAAQELETKWKPYDEYARNNPDWFSHWQNAWENRSTFQDGQTSEGQPAPQIPDSVRQKLEEQGRVIDELQSRFQSQDEQQNDEALSQEIKSIQDQYPNLDFRATDPDTGKSLEQQVIDYAIQNNIGSFKTAFRDFYHDNLVKLERERAREEYAKSQQEQRKKGIIGTSPTPQSQSQTAAPRDASWSQLEEMALQELGLN